MVDGRAPDSRAGKEALLTGMSSDQCRMLSEDLIGNALGIFLALWRPATSCPGNFWSYQDGGELNDCCIISPTEIVAGSCSGIGSLDVVLSSSVLILDMSMNKTGI
jgi:hypothetical protein